MKKEIYMRNYRVWNPQKAPETVYWFLASAIAEAFKLAVKTKRETLVTLDEDDVNGITVRSRKVAIIRGNHLESGAFAGRTGSLKFDGKTSLSDES